MNKTTFYINAMDCGAEEQLIRLTLEGNANIHDLRFDLRERELHVFHTGPSEPIADALASIRLPGVIRQSAATSFEHSSRAGQKKTLIWVLSINALFFVLELTYGLVSQSMGLVADSLDMLADSLVYGMALLAISRTQAFKKNVAAISAVFQFTLAVAGLVEVARRVFGNAVVPDFSTMIVVSFLALTANAICLYLLQKGKSDEAHMKASIIFTSNDVIINLGVITAGGLVWYFSTPWPDLIIGTLVFILVTRGAVRIWKLSR